MTDARTNDLLLAPDDLCLAVTRLETQPERSSGFHYPIVLHHSHTWTWAPGSRDAAASRTCNSAQRVGRRMRIHEPWQNRANTSAYLLITAAAIYRHVRINTGRRGGSQPIWAPEACGKRPHDWGGWPVSGPVVFQTLKIPLAIFVMFRFSKASLSGHQALLPSLVAVIKSCRSFGPVRLELYHA